MAVSIGSAKILGIGVLAGLLAGGCGTENDGSTTPDAPAGATDLYVVQRGTADETARLSAYRVDATTGRLTAAGSVTLPLGARAHEVAVDPANRYVYVATRQDGPAGSSVRGLLYGFARDQATGALTGLAGSPFGDAQGGDFRSPVFDASGRFLYVSDPLSETIDAFLFDSANGRLQPLAGRNAFPAENNVGGAAVAGASLFATSSAGHVLAYALDAAGALRSAQAPLDAGRDTAIPAIHPGGRFLYAPNAGSNDVSGYSVDGSGRLAALAGSPFSAGAGPVALAIAPSGAAAYVLNGLESTVSSFGIDTATGALRPLGAAAPAGGTAGGSGAIAVEPSGRFVYVASFASGTLAAFAVDGAGDLRPVAGATVQVARPVALAVTHARK